MRTARLRDGDRGETTTQMVVIVPVIITLLFLIVHIAVLSHASHVAQVAALRGAQIAASANGSVDELGRAIQQSQRIAREMGATITSRPQLKWGERSVGMAVRVTTQSVVPFLPHEVERIVWVAEEKFILEQNR